VWHLCPGCGEPGQLRSRRCARCSLRQRLEELLRQDTGSIHPRLRALHDNLAGHERPETVLAWLNKQTASVIVRELAVGQRALTHAALDELPDTKPLRHLRSVLIATGALPPRDEHLARLEQAIATTIAGRGDPEQRALLHRYAIWNCLHRLRRRNNGQPATNGQAVGIQQQLKAAITLLDWLTAHDLDLGSARQGDLDIWLGSEQVTGRHAAGHFVRWAKRQKLTTLDFAATKWAGPNGDIDGEARWVQARRLLHEQSIKPEDRVAGLLVLLYANGPRRSAASPWTTCTPTSSSYGSGWVANPSSCPNPSQPSSASSSRPAGDTPPLAIRETRRGCSLADVPANRSAPPT
jgi:hypothetical protein